jgi:hypothetical protein
MPRGSVGQAFSLSLFAGYFVIPRFAWNDKGEGNFFRSL